MALEDIKKSILEKTQEKIAELEKQANIKIAEIDNEWSKKVESQNKEILSRSEQKAKLKLQQAIFLVKSQNHSELLKKKREIIEKSFQKALEKLSALNDDEYVSLNKKLIAKLPLIAGELISVKNKSKLLEKALFAAKRPELKISEKTIDGRGGFVFKTEKIEIDNRFEILAQNKKNALEIQLANLLFN